MSVSFKHKALATPGSGHTVVGYGATGRLSVKSVGGVEHDLLPVEDVRKWGAVGDGVIDDTAAIQAAIDYAIYSSLSASADAIGYRVKLPAGTYKTTDTIHIGYGTTTYRSVVIEGDGYNFRGDEQMCGTYIVPTFSDRPAFNFQGARGSVIRNLSIIGQLQTYIVAQEFFEAVPLLDDTDPANWHDPSLAATQDARYAPYAGIAIDAYAGVRPATSYPDVVYPAFMGAVAQYNKLFSSDVLIENVYIQGFTVAVVNQPCDADGNGDFTSIHDCYFERCKWGVSIGNTQSRNVSVQCLQASRMYAVFTNRTHGKQQGKFAGAIIDLSIWSVINIIDFGSFYAQPISFINLYAESLWKIGNYESTSTNEHSFIFQTCEFSFAAQTDVRGVPAYVLAGSGQQTANIRFNGCYFHNYPSVVVFIHGSTIFDGCYFRTDSARTATYEKFSHNVLSGGVVIPVNQKMRSHRQLKHVYYDLDTGVKTVLPIVTGEVQSLATRNICTSLYANQIVAGSDQSTPAITMPAIGSNSQTKASLASISLVDKTLTFSFSSRTDVTFYYNGPLPGDVIWDSDSGSVFFVRSRTDVTVIAELQNNYKSDGAGGFDPVTPFSTSVGTFYFVNSRFYTPQYYLRGDMTSGSAIIANCARDDDFAAWYDAQIAVNDYVYVNVRSDNWKSSSTSLVSARDQAAGTITLSNSAGMRTATRKRLELFIRQPPANV